MSWTEGAQCGRGLEAEKSLVWLEGKESEGPGGGEVRVRWKPAETTLGHMWSLGFY